MSNPPGSLVGQHLPVFLTSYMAFPFAATNRLSHCSPAFVKSINSPYRPFPLVSTLAAFVR